MCKTALHSHEKTTQRKGEILNCQLTITLLFIQQIQLVFFDHIR